MTEFAEEILRFERNRSDFWAQAYSGLSEENARLKAYSALPEENARLRIALQAALCALEYMTENVYGQEFAHVRDTVALVKGVLK